jgi:hypothetical protein
MSDNKIAIDRVGGYVRQLTPQARSRLLVELERLHLQGDDVQGTEPLLAELRAEFRKGGQQAQDRVKSPSRYFFQPLEPMLVNCSPEQAGLGQISRGSLSAIWEWIGQTLLPAMTREYDAEMRPIALAERQFEAHQVVTAFQVKIVKSLEAAFTTAAGVERIRGEVAMYTSARGAFMDLTKMLVVLQASDALEKFSAALPPKIALFEGGVLSKLQHQLDGLSAQFPNALPFGLTLLMRRLETPWQLIRLATKSAGSRSAAALAGTPYKIAVTMVLDHLDEKRRALEQALASNRVTIAKDLLAEICGIERALHRNIAKLGASDWGRRLDQLMREVSVHLDAELHKLPTDLHHVLKLPARHDSLVSRLVDVAQRSRESLIGGARFCRNLIAD